MARTLREIKGSKLSHLELDQNAAERVTQASHGFTVGQFLKYQGGATPWALAQANNPANVADAIVIALVAGGDDFYVLREAGAASWTHALGGSDGDQAWLSQSTPGAATLTQPSSGVQQPLGKRGDSATFHFRLGFTHMGQ